MKEKDYQVKFSAWLRTSWKQTGAYELKVAPDKRLFFAQLAPHQKNWLMAVKHASAVYKMPDDSIGFKPFDCWCLAVVPAYVVTIFNSRFYLIDIDVWDKAEKEMPARSLLEDEAQKIAHYSAKF